MPAPSATKPSPAPICPALGGKGRTGQSSASSRARVFRGDHLTVQPLTELRRDASLKWPQANNRAEHQAHESAQGGRSMVFQQPADEIADPNNTRRHAQADRYDDP